MSPPTASANPGAAAALQAIWPEASFSPTEAALLWCLMLHAGRAVPRAALLREVWGYAPAVASRTVETTIARVRQKIEPDPARPIHLLTLRGQGYLLHLPRAFGPCPPIPRCRDLVGRDAVVEEVRALLAGGARLVTLIGAPGIGKTTVARRLLTEAADAGRTVWFADLALSGDLPAFLGAVGRAVGGTGPCTEAEIGERLAALQPCLGALDNLEQLPDEVARCIGRWSDAWPGVQLVGTSHRPLGLDAERVVRVGGLDDADAEHLVRRALERRGLVGDDAAVREVVRIGAGHPLALELSAPATAAGSAEPWPSRRVDQPDRQVTLEALVDRALGLLPPDLVEPLVSAAVFRGALTAQVAAGLWAVDPPEAARTLVDLADRSLLVPGPGATFALPEALRAPLLRRIARHPRRAAIYQRYVAWACARRVDVVHLEALLTEAPATPALVSAAIRTFRDEGRLERLAGLLDLVSPAGPELRPWLQLARAACLVVQGALDQADALLDRAMVVADARRDDEIRWRLRLERAWVARRAERFDEMSRWLHGAEEIARVGGDAAVLAATLAYRALWASVVGDPSLGDLVAQAQELYRRAGLRDDAGELEQLRASAHVQAGDWAVAARILEASIPELPGRVHQIRNRTRLGHVYLVLGRLDRAREALEGAVAADPRAAPDNALLGFGIAVLELLEGAPEARAAFADRRDADPDSFEGRVRRAFTALVLDDRATLDVLDDPPGRCARRIAGGHGGPLDLEALRDALGQLLRARA